MAEKKHNTTVVDDLTCIMDKQLTDGLRIVADSVPLRGHPQHKDDLDDLIVEREWFDKKFPQRVAALVRHHRERHGKDPRRVFLPTKFVDWIVKRWGDRLTFEIPPEPAPLLVDPESGEMRTEPVPVMIETASLEVVRAIRLEAAHDAIRLDTVLQSSEASIRCGYCRGEFPLLVAERWTRVGCPHCRRMLLIVRNVATDELVIYSMREIDKEGSR